MSTTLKQTLAAKRLGMPLLAWGILVLTTVLSLAWSHARLLWVDEFFALYSDSVPTFRDVLRVQRDYPIVIDPPVQHLMTHAFMDVIGRNAMAVRLPSLLGFLLLQVSLYAFVNKIAGRRAAVIAMTFPLISTTVYHSANGRPYALMTGLFMLSLACWQSAMRAEGDGRSRMPALVGLWLALALAISTQYFGFLALIPVCLAEAVRTVSRRRNDKGMVTTLLLGVASISLILPFLKGTKIYRLHYIPTDTSMRYVLEIYRNILQDGPYQLAHRSQIALIAVLALVIITGAVLRLRRRTHSDTVHEWVALLALAMLPIFGHFVQVYVSHTMMARYVLPTVGAFAAGIGIVLQRPAQNKAVFTGIMVLLLGVGVSINLWDIGWERNHSAEILAGWNEPPEVKRELASDPSRRIYIQTLNEYLTYSYYGPDPALRARLTLLTDQQQLQWEGFDGFYILTENMRHFAPLPIVPYDDFLRLQKPLIVFYTQQPDGDVWIDRDLKARGRQVQVVGPWLRGYLAEAPSAAESAPQP